jgi:uncharacterized protein YidB (DUF937 family)
MMLLVSKALTKRSDEAKRGGEAEPASSAAEGGLGSLIEKFRSGGLDDVIKSWIGTGANKSIAPHQLQHALGPDTVASLERETGMPRNDLLSQLSRILPDVIDNLTPDGNLPKESDLLPMEAGERRQAAMTAEKSRCGRWY